MDLPEVWDALKDEILSFGTTSKDTIPEASAGRGKTDIFVIVCEERSYTPPSMSRRLRAFLKLRSTFSAFFAKLTITLAFSL
jgi:hypothetical protein